MDKSSYTKMNYIILSLATFELIYFTVFLQRFYRFIKKMNYKIK